MKNIRTISIIFILILTVFLMFERIDIASKYDVTINEYVYVLGIAGVVIQIMLYHTTRLNFYLLTAIPFLIYFICKINFESTDQPFQDNQLFTTLIELVLLLCLTLFARLYASAVCDVNKIIHNYSPHAYFYSLALWHVMNARNSLIILFLSLFLWPPQML